VRCGVRGDEVRGVPGGAGRPVGEDGVDVAADVVGGGLVDGRDIDAAGAEHPGAFGDDGPGVGIGGRQMQQPDADDGVEPFVREGQSAAVGADHGAGEPGRGPADHRGRAVHPGHPDVRPGLGEPTGDDAGAAADVRQPAAPSGQQTEDGRCRRGGPWLAAA